MKKFLLAAFAIAAICTTKVNAQDKPMQVNVVQNYQVKMAGDFNVRSGYSDTAVHMVTGTRMPTLSRLDTATHTAAANDSVHERVEGNYQYVALEVHLTKTAGRSDSVDVNIWGTAWPGNGTTYRLLKTQTIGNVSNEQFVYWEQPYLGAWMYTNLRVTVTVRNLAVNSAVAWQAALLVR